MGIFYETEEVVNRAPVDISVTFDGQDIRLKPGKSSLLKIAVPFGKNQNPVMGSVDHTNPHISGGEYLIGVVGEDNCEPLTPEQWEAHLNAPSRVNEQAAFEDKYGADPKARLVLTGKGRKTFINSRSETVSAKGSLSTLREQK